MNELPVEASFEAENLTFLEFRQGQCLELARTPSTKRGRGRRSGDDVQRGGGSRRHAQQSGRPGGRSRSARSGLPLWPVFLPWPCDNAEYEAQMSKLLTAAREQGITHFAFGDLFLEDIRAYRERQLAGTGITPLFPLWGTPADTPALARTMLAAGVRAILTCVDPQQLDGRFRGRRVRLGTARGATCDSRSVRGNAANSTLSATQGPMFSKPVPVHVVGEKGMRDGFHFADLLLVE